jgi:hypothetical protein
LPHDYCDYSGFQAFWFNPGNPEVIPRLINTLGLLTTYGDFKYSGKHEVCPYVKSYGRQKEKEE